MIDTDKYEGHTPAPWEADLDDEGKRWIDAYDDEGDINLCRITNGNKADAQLIADAPLLLEEVKRLRKALHIEEQIVQAFYEYREACCFDHCEAWMLENGHRVMVKIDDDEQSEWKVEVE